MKTFTYIYSLRLVIMVVLLGIAVASCDKEKMSVADNSGSWTVESVEIKTMEGEIVASDNIIPSAGYILLYNNGSTLADANLCIYHFDSAVNSKAFKKMNDAALSEFDGNCFWASGPNRNNRITLHADGQIGKVEISFTVEPIDNNRAKWHYIESSGSHYYRETYTVNRGQ